MVVIFTYNIDSYIRFVGIVIENICRHTSELKTYQMYVRHTASQKMISQRSKWLGEEEGCRRKATRYNVALFLNNPDG